MATLPNQFLLAAALVFVGALGFQAVMMARARPLEDDAAMAARHEQWMQQYGRVYSDEKERNARYKVFKRNVEFIESFNNGSGKSYKLGLNKFADLTDDEFKAFYTGIKPTNKSDTKLGSFSYQNYTEAEAPSHMDWREKGAVTDVKNQGRCESCWAFSAVAAVEGITQITTGKQLSLSEQELVDCDTGGESHGCNKGSVIEAFNFIQSYGLTTDSNYPYQGVDGNCNTAATTPAAKISGYDVVPANDEAALLMAVAKQPVSVVLDGGGSFFRMYKSGVFSGECNTDQNHAVTVVGYGMEADGSKYWLVKNSWGTDWGESGYMKIQRDAGVEGGMCGLARSASYPVA